MHTWSIQVSTRSEQSYHVRVLQTLGGDGSPWRQRREGLHLENGRGNDAPHMRRVRPMDPISVRDGDEPNMLAHDMKAAGSFLTLCCYFHCANMLSFVCNNSYVIIVRP